MYNRGGICTIEKLCTIEEVKLCTALLQEVLVCTILVEDITYAMYNTCRAG